MGQKEGDLLSIGAEGPYDGLAHVLVQAEQFEGIVVAGVDQAF
jgi:hypothetical protein